jgi:hypothetical protein
MLENMPLMQRIPSPWWQPTRTDMTLFNVEPVGTARLCVCAA